MAIKRQDEVLAKAVSTDTAVIPRYDIKRPDGTKVAENIALELKNTVISEGTPVNKQLLDEMLAASGTCGGTASALTLAQEGFSLVDGAVVRCKVTADLAENATLNINNTGAKYIYSASAEKIGRRGVKANVWLLLIYSSALDGYVLINDSIKYTTVTAIFTASTEWQCPFGVKTVHALAFGGGSGGHNGGQNGGMGGNGGEMSSQTLSVEPGTVYPITIGAGGEAGSSGGTTSFGTLLSANGGSNSIGGGTGGGGGGTSYSENGSPGQNGSYGGAGGGGGGTYGGAGGTGSTANGASGGSTGGRGGNGLAIAGGDGSGGSGGSSNGGGGGGGGYGGKGGKGGPSSSNYYGGGGGGGGGYGVNGNGGNGGSGLVGGVKGGNGGNGGIAAGGGGGGDGSGGNGGPGILILTYVVEG
jgi:hypothetical protein